MARLLNSGEKFGRLTVKGPTEKRNANGSILWQCSCDCGKKHTATAANLIKGVTRSCGCYRAETPTNLRHGHKRGDFESKTYRAWVNVKRRCNGKTLASWSDYGGRGITYDPRWENFEAFLEDMGEAPPGTSMDRINNDLGYSKENCRWVDWRQNNNNRRVSLHLEYEGRTLSLSEWSEETGIAYDTILQRFKKNWPAEKILSRVHYDKHGYIRALPEPPRSD